MARQDVADGSGSWHADARRKEAFLSEPGRRGVVVALLSEKKAAMARRRYGALKHDRWLISSLRCKEVCGCAQPPGWHGYRVSGGAHREPLHAAPCLGGQLHLFFERELFF